VHLLAVRPGIKRSNPPPYVTLALPLCAKPCLLRGRDMRPDTVHMVFDGVQRSRLIAETARMARRDSVGMKVRQEQPAADAAHARQLTISRQWIANVPDHETTPDNIERFGREGQRTHIGNR